MDFDALKTSFLSYFGRLSNFDFSFRNPVFWAFLVLAFLILLKFWAAKKSFSFCIVIGAILLAATKVEGLVRKAVTKPGETFDPLLIRMGALCIIAFIVVYYIFLKESEF